MRLLLLIGLIIAEIGYAAPVKKGAHKSHKKKKHAAVASRLSTDIQFNDSLLHGHYQTPDDTTARVENEKVLADLLGVRTQFKDRLNKASEQN